ncbi:MAG: hypothetical protein F6J93_02665 [Oscillatoria sp. SIO1A7]|nr:hypothetical protein [Oscillatoria sp. SIO1A7]
MKRKKPWPMRQCECLFPDRFSLGVFIGLRREHDVSLHPTPYTLHPTPYTLAS